MSAKINFISHFPEKSFFYQQTKEFISLTQDDVLVDILTIEDFPPPPTDQASPEEMEKLESLILQKYEEKITEVSQTDSSTILLGSTNDPIPVINKFKQLPVMGMGFTSYWTASMLADEFSIFTPFEGYDPIYKNQLSLYQLESNCSSIEYIPFNPYEPREKLNIDNDLITTCVEKIEMLADKGIKVIVIGCGSPQFSFNALEINKIAQQEMNVTVLSPIKTGIEVCKALAQSKSV